MRATGRRLLTSGRSRPGFGVGERVAELFSEDGAFVSPLGTMQGRTELQRGFQQLSNANTGVTRHVCSNFLCEVVDEDRAEGVVYVTLCSHNRHDGPVGTEKGAVAPLNGPKMIGEYRDRYVRTSSGWRFAERKVAVTFFRGGS